MHPTAKALLGNGSERCGRRRRHGVIQRNIYPDICLEVLRKNKKISIRIVVLRVEILTRNSSD